MSCILFRLSDKWFYKFTKRFCFSYSGEDSLNYVFYCLGANGTISVTANVFADRVEAIYQNVKNGNFNAALEIQNELEDVNKAMFVETNPIPIKTFMSHLELIDAEVRMPLVGASNETVSLLVKLYNRLRDNKTILI